jgi:hypothetical protein
LLKLAAPLDCGLVLVLRSLLGGVARSLCGGACGTRFGSFAACGIELA